MNALQRKDSFLLALLFLVVMLIFYPLFSAEYIYTDEVNQLWLYRPGSNFSMFAQQGRWITEWLMSTLFSAVDSIRELTYLRVFALVSWLLCIPLWYTIVKRLVAAAPGYEYLPFLTCLYLVTSLPFAITIQWASCMEMAIANTAGLLSGAIWYLGIREKKKGEIPLTAGLGAILTGFVSLCTYQSGFGCFLIPFLFHYVSAFTTRKDLVFIKGLAVYFLIYAIYFIAFKLYVSVTHVASDPRTGIYINPPYKLYYFLSKPLKRAFWFNIIVNDESRVAKIIYLALFAGWILLAFLRFGKKNLPGAGKYLAAVLLVFLISQLPSLVVKENYASNRTMLGLYMSVWIVCADMVMHFVKTTALCRTIAIGQAILLLAFGWYNFNKLFLQPVREEYRAIRNYLQQQYTRRTTTIYFIRPAEDAFSRKYQLPSSMDEFGVPSTYFEWVPENLVQQMVFEMTGSRRIAEQLVVKHWPDTARFAASGVTVTGNVLVVNAPALIDAENTKH
ncbi:glucosyltransferase domain-containing protein [Longitalea arenae]|uniref:glucosyltransferase domain-containing protein n=1 Tax=Longitalea arenae TaxID=2812558 RepID=UPI001967138D|nr:hypothetical protein [Longitalea arenae]